MRYFLLPIVLLLGITCAHCADLTLVKNGKAQCAIYVPAAIMAPDVERLKAAYEDPQYQPELDRIRLRESVHDLAVYLGKMSGAVIPVKTGAPATEQGEAPILIGALAEVKYGKPKQHSPLMQGWRLVVDARSVGLLGESDQATSYAIYELLDRLGCRWFMPSEMGECIPSVKTISLQPTDISAVPPTVRRVIWSGDPDYVRRNRLGGTGLELAHALEFYMPKEEMEKHLDWNAEIGGKRSVNGRYCFASSELANAVADKLIAQLDAHYTPSISLSPNDGATFCDCAKCKALDAGDVDTTMGCVSITDRYVHFINQIAERVCKKYPNVTFGFLAYVQYTRPPIRERLHPNLVPVIAPITYCREHSMLNLDCPSRQELRKIIEGWGKAAKQIALYEYAYNLAEVSAPNPMITKWSEDLSIAYQNHMTYWLPETLNNFDTVLPGFYLGERLALNPSAKPQAIIDEFYTRFYGSAAVPMRKYWETIDQAWSKTPEHAGSLFGYMRIFPPEVMKAARADLDEALLGAKTPVEQQRIELANAAFQQFELWMKMEYNLADGKLIGLTEDAGVWLKTQKALASQYAPQRSFTVTGDLGDFPDGTIAATYLNMFCKSTYTDAERIAKEDTIMTAPIRQWRYQADKDKSGEQQGWNAIKYADDAWKTTDTAVDSLADLKLEAFFGPIWYRHTVHVGDIPTGKKVYLWISRYDEICRAYVNGKPVMAKNEKGEAVSSITGFATPVSFDITAAIQPNADNQITIQVTHDVLNEVGTGGLMGPVFLYREK